MSTIKVQNIQHTGSSTNAIALASDGTCTANITSVNDGQLGNRNKIYNGKMAVAQRSQSVSSITASGMYTCDRWQTTITTCGTWTQSQSTDVPTGEGFSKSLKMDCTTADASLAAGDRIFISQRFEGQDLQDFCKGTSSAKQYTLSFYVKSAKTGTHVVELLDHDSAFRHVCGTYTISSPDTWEKKTITFPADTTGAFDDDNAKSLEVQWYLAAGSTYQSGTLATSWASVTNGNRATGQVNVADNTANNWYLTGVQLEVGSVATDFEHRLFGQELALCQRYFQKSFAAETPPAVSESKCIYSFTRPYTSGYHEALGNDYVVEMRTQPSVTFYPIQGSGSVGQVSYYDSGWSNTTASYHTGHSTSKRLVFSINTTSTTTLVQYNYTLSSEL